MSRQNLVEQLKALGISENTAQFALSVGEGIRYMTDFWCRKRGMMRIEQRIMVSPEKHIPSQPPPLSVMAGHLPQKGVYPFCSIEERFTWS